MLFDYHKKETAKAYVGNSFIKSCPCVKLLGVEVDTALFFADQIETTTGKKTNNK